MIEREPSQPEPGPLSRSLAFTDSRLQSLANHRQHRTHRTRPHRPSCVALPLPPPPLGPPLPPPPLAHPLPHHPTMPYQLCVLGCGTMGVAVLSGVLDNLQSPRAQLRPTDDSSPSTPMGSLILDPNANPDSLPDRFIATVNRAESAKKLRRTFSDLGVLGGLVQVRQAHDNVRSVKESDVILLWSVTSTPLCPAHRRVSSPDPLTQLQAPTRGPPPPPAGHVGRSRGQAPHLDPRRHHHLDDARLGPRVVHRRAQHAQHPLKGAPRRLPPSAPPERVCTDRPTRTRRSARA